MTIGQHGVIKPEKLATLAVGMLEQELIIPNLFVKQGIDQFRGAKDDTVSFPVEGVLPFHEYAWRNDRAEPIKFDLYNERKISVTFGGHAYSAVQMIDEQADMDMARWAKLLTPQVKAVARGLNRAAARTMIDADFEVTLGDAAADLKGQIIEARRVLNLLHAPTDNRYLLCGTNFESLLLAKDQLALAQNVGDAESVSLLTQATIGSRYGFRIVVDQTIDPDTAYACAGSAFVFANAAPSVPASVKAGGTTAYEGIAIRWMQDYSADFLADRSVVDSYYGFRPVTDLLVGYDETAKSEFISTDEHMIRAIELKLDGASVYPEVGSDLAKVAGVGVTKPGAHLQGAAATKAND